MWKSLILLSICLTVNGHVLPDGSAMAERPEDFNILHYVKHFRQIISDYITAQYKTTVEELDNVATVLDGFFKRLASDLNEVMNNNDKDWESKKVEDGLPDEKFEEIKKNIQQQYPEIKEKSANEMMYRLRINLYETKQKLDEVMKEEKKIKQDQSSEEYDS